MAASDEVSSAQYRAAIQRVFDRTFGRMVPDLDRIRHLMDLLGNPQTSFDSIHLTGTNGKTSTTMMTAALLNASGRSAGTFTSPHLQDVRERIHVNGAVIGEEDLVRQLAYLDPFLAVVDRDHDEKVTFFEVFVATAYLHFADAPVDVAVVEVGMGGTWDATNVIDAQVAVLCRIAKDHKMLGETPEQIATEKVGIIKPGANVITATQRPEVMAVIEKRCRDVDATLTVAGRDFEVLSSSEAVGGQMIDLRTVTGTHHEVFLPLFGAHQATNAALAVAAFEAYVGFDVEVDHELLEEGLAAAGVPGRLEPVPSEDQALVLLDGAHNPAGAETLAASLPRSFSFERCVGIVGVMDDKEVEAMVAAFAPLFDHVVVVAPSNTRAADPARLETAFNDLQVSCEIADDVEHALDLAYGVTRPSDGIVVTGSLYLVGEAREALGLEPA